MKQRKILVTAALPYANGPIHLGHLVEYIQTDIWVRFQKLRGHQCVFMWADDTHGTAIMIRARKEGRSEEEVIAEASEDHRREFESPLTAQVPRRYHDPSYIRVRHSPPTPMWVKILAGLGVAALGGLLTLIAVLFCRFRQSTTTVRINASGRRSRRASNEYENDTELKPLNNTE